MDWYNIEGQSMSETDWNSPGERTLQYVAASTPEHEEFNRILMIVHGHEAEETVVLPTHSGVGGYTLLFDSALDQIESEEHAPGTKLTMSPTSMKLLRAHQSS
jgi:glycogen operon protein